MKVFFLDFDGVINNWDHFEGVDFNNIKPLLKIIELTNAKIVITSSKKYSFQRNKIEYERTSFSKYEKKMNEYGIEIHDVTPYICGCKGKEILAYLAFHSEVEEFLILDDEYILDSLKEHQVLLDLYKGIQKEHIIPSINILNGKLGFYPKDYDFSLTEEEKLIRINKYYL